MKKLLVLGLLLAGCSTGVTIKREIKCRPTPAKETEHKPAYLVTAEVYYFDTDEDRQDFMKNLPLEKKVLALEASLEARRTEKGKWKYWVYVIPR